MRLRCGIAFQAAVIFYNDAASIPPHAHVITLTDTIADQPAGVLGYHTEDQGGKLWGIVAAQPELSNGGQVSTGDWSVSSVLSHEVLEMYIDPNCNLWSNDGRGSIYTFEVCDPVEAPSYAVDGVSVSNFVTPAWFDPQAAPTAQFDKLGLLTAPFGIVERRLRCLRNGRQGAAEIRRRFPAVAAGYEARSLRPHPASDRAGDGDRARLIGGNRTPNNLNQAYGLAVMSAVHIARKGRS